MHETYPWAHYFHTLYNCVCVSQKMPRSKQCIEKKFHLNLNEEYIVLTFTFETRKCTVLDEYIYIHISTLLSDKVDH